MNLNSLLMVLVFLLFNCCQRDTYKLKNSFRPLEPDALAENLKAYKNYLKEDIGQKRLDIQFFNNPYNLDSACHLTVIVSGGMIYSGKFKQYLQAHIPKEFYNLKHEVEFLIEQNNDAYKFNTMQIVELSETDDLLQIVFLPEESDWFTFYFMFTNGNKSRESL